MTTDIRYRAKILTAKALRFVAGTGVALGMVLVGAAGCKDQKQCDDAAQTTRKAVELRDFASARQWREYSWKMCRDRTLIDNIDKDIVSAEEAVAKEIEEAEKKAIELAKQQINAAQGLWLKYDASELKDKTVESLDAALKHARALGVALKAELKAQFDAYNQREHARRSGELKSK